MCLELGLSGSLSPTSKMSPATCMLFVSEDLNYWLIFQDCSRRDVESRHLFLFLLNWRILDLSQESFHIPISRTVVSFFMFLCCKVMM